MHAYVKCRVNLLVSLVHGLDETKTILSDLQDFNKKSWVVRYPSFRDQPSSSSPTQKRANIRRSMTFVDDPKTETEVTFTPRTRMGQPRSLSLASIKDASDAEELGEDVDEQKVKESTGRLVPQSSDLDFHVLRLDLKLGPHGSSSSTSSLVTQLEKSSIANLLDDRINASMQHVDKLRQRVEDTSSKVLVTGDLNSGKSTLVNALLRREVMPVDQQPCTTAFCEVHDAAENNGVEEVHIVKEGVTYSPQDEATFTRVSIADLEYHIAENEDIKQMVKVYIKDARPSSDSFLNNGIADISLIDAPGLNRDSVKTTALFARQEEIDVVVFVVSAENHFTLSAREFLESASREKAYVFIVVNKFEGIKNKDKCKRVVLDQIKQLSPRTYDDAVDLVHFVDSASVLGVDPSSAAFESLESSLRSFVLIKRSKSKLQPAATFLTHLLADVDLLAGSNAILAKTELEQAKDDLNRTRPILELLKNTRDELEESLEQLEENGATSASRKTKDVLGQALEKVGSGSLACERTAVPMPTYPGLLGIWDYTRNVRRALLASLDAAVKLAEDEARIITSSGVKGISDVGDKYLPEGVDRSKRVFMPEAMFARRRSTKDGKLRRASAGTVVAGGLYGLGIGLAQRQEMLEPTFFDIFDLQHQFHLYFGSDDEKAAAKKQAEDEEEDSLPSALGVVSVGLGALTMVGGKAIGARGVIEGFIRISDLFENETARKWAAPVIGAVALGASVYLILELPNTIPRTVGRRIRAALMKPDEHAHAKHGHGAEETTFIGIHSARISRETRKVLRIASWDMKERFRGAMETNAREVERAEKIERQSESALSWFGEVQKRTGQVRDEISVIGDL